MTITLSRKAEITATGDHLDIGDTGCFDDAYGMSHPSCLNCPLPFCKYEVPPFTHASRAKNDNAVLAVMDGVVPDSLPKGKADRLARKLGITPRTVYRALERLRER